MSKISIIIPAYNAVDTIERTLRSVLMSSIGVDIFVVDDGSSDGTGEFLEMFAREQRVPEHSSVTIIRQANSGAYQARLNALKRVETSWFGFVDADDTVEPDMFEKMLSLAERENLDVVQCGHEYEGVVSCAWRSDSGDAKVLNNREEVYSEYIYPKLLDIKEASFIWDKVYRNQYDFDKFVATDRVTNFDDMIFNLQFFLPVNRMGFINKGLYHYSSTPGSAVRRFNEKKLKDFRVAYNMRKLFLPKYGLKPLGRENKDWLRLNKLSCAKVAIMDKGQSLVNRLLLLAKIYAVR